MKSKIILLSLLGSMLVSFNVFAGPSSVPPIITGSGSQTNTENRAFAGLVWTLQEKMSAIPDLTVGFRSLRVKSTDSVNGVEVSARIKLKEGVSFDSARLSYVGGERDVLGNVGLGYSLSKSSFLGTLAVQGAYSRLGTDYQFNVNKFVPYIEALTLDKPNKVSEKPGGIGCPPDYPYGPFNNNTFCSNSPD